MQQKSLKKCYCILEYINKEIQASLSYDKEKTVKHTFHPKIDKQQKNFENLIYIILYGYKKVKE